MADMTLGVLITADASQVEQEAAKAEKAIGGIGEQAEKTSGQAAQNFAQRLGSSMQSAGKGISDASKGITEFGKSVSILTAPLEGMGLKGTKSFLEVDKTMQLTNKTMGNTAEQAELLQNAMEKAASNSVFGMTDAANASLNFARAGLDAEQAAAALAPAMNLAAGEGGNLNTVSAGLTATINGFGDSFDNSSHYADVFAAACNNSALDVDGLASSMNVAAPVFSAAGKNVEDAALYMGVMANAGYDASTAANSLKTGMARLAKPAKEASDAMDAYLGGWSAFNEDGTMKSSLQIQKELHDGFANLSEQEQMAAASAIFGKNQMAPWLALINTAPDDVDALSESLGNCGGTTEEMANAMMEGAGGSVEKLKSSLDVLSTKFGEIIADNLLPLANAVQGVVDWFMGLDEGTQRVIGTFAMIIAIMGPAAIAIGLVGGAVGNLMTIFGTLVESIGAMSIAAVAPILAIVAVVAILVAAFIYLWNTNEEFRTAVSEIWAAIVAAFVEFFTQIKDGLASVGITTETLKAVWDAFCQAVGTMLIVTMDLIMGAIQFALDFVMGALKIFIGFFTGDWEMLWDGVKQIASGTWDLIKAIFKAFCDFMGINANELKEKIKEKFTELKDGAVEKVTELKDKAVEIFTNILSAVSEKAGEIVDTIQEGFDSAVDYITGLIDDAWNWGADLVSNIADGIWSGIGEVKDAVWDVGGTIFGNLHFSEPDEGPLADFHTWMPDMMHGLADGMKKNLPTLRAGVELVANEMSGIIPGTGNSYGYDGGHGGSGFGNVYITVNGAPGQDESEIADRVMDRIMNLVIPEV